MRKSENKLPAAYAVIIVALPAIQNKLSAFLHLEFQEEYLVHPLFEDYQVIHLELLVKVIIL